MINSNQALQRYFLCEVQNSDNSMLSIGSPLRAEISIVKTIRGSLNTAEINITNIEPQTRRQIEVDRYQTQNPLSFGSSNNATQKLNPLYRRIKIYAGYTTPQNYNQPPPLIFQGNILEAKTIKPNTTEPTLQIQAQDGIFGYVNSYSNVSISEPTNSQFVIRQLLSQMKNVEMGYVSKIPSKDLPRGYASNAQAFKELQTLASINPVENSGADVFIDNEKLNILGSSEAFLNPSIALLNEDFLETPEATQTSITIKVLFNPNIQLGQELEIMSSYNTWMNGVYKVCTIEHIGVFSATSAEPCHTIIQLWRNPAGSLTTVIRQ